MFTHEILSFNFYILQFTLIIEELLLLSLLNLQQIFFGLFTGFIKIGHYNLTILLYFNRHRHQRFFSLKNGLSQLLLITVTPIKEWIDFQ